MKIGNKEFDTKNHTYIMGILNVTPDSFYDGGKYKNRDEALMFAGQLIADGADILDIGGESTRPGFVQISVQEEIDRTANLIESIKARFDIPISIDTYKADVAKIALDAGADIVNDVWGLQKDTDMAGVVAESGAVCILGHNREKVGYSAFLTEFDKDMRTMLKTARAAGICDDKIIIDPGIGFAKDLQQSLASFAHILHCSIGYPVLNRSIAYPVLIGASNKSCIGGVLDLAVGERLVGTLATTAYAVLHGAAFVRVHNVKENVQVVNMLQAIKDSYRQERQKGN